MPFFGTTPFAAPGLGIIASAVMLGFDLWWLGRDEAAARRTGEPFGAGEPAKMGKVTEDQALRDRATTAREFDQAELPHGRHGATSPRAGLAALPLVVVIVNLVMSFLVLPRLDASFLAEERWGATSLHAVGGVWAVVTALAAAIVTVIAINWSRLPSFRATMDAGANASVLSALCVASIVGFGAVVAAMPAFAVVRGWVLGIGSGPLLSLAAATNVLAALTGSASGGLTIALDSLGSTHLVLAMERGIDPSLLHRVAVIGSGTLDSLPHDGAVVTLLAVCGTTHRESYFDIVMVAIVGALIALAVVIVPFKPNMDTIHHWSRGGARELGTGFPQLGRGHRER
jgi:H+/gluconate symporter-like permease